MKTNYTIPSLSSIESNRIKDLTYVENYFEELRLIRLSGFPVRLKINKNYVELTSTEVEIDLSAYKPIFEKLMNFFYGDGYVYGYVNNNKLVVYDIYTNDNFFSSRDLERISFETCLPIAEPIYEGNFSFDFLISVLNKKINNEGIPAEELYLLPSVYINDKREWVETKEKEIDTVILGEKKTYPVYNSTYGTYNNLTTNNNIIEPVKPNKKEKEPNKIIKYPVFILSTKEERTAIFNETYKNISKYIEKNSKFFTKGCLDWWNKKGKFYCYWYSIHTLPATRQLVYDYCSFYYLDDLSKYISLTEKWTELFINMFDEDYEDIMKKVNIDLNVFDYFNQCFCEELNEFNKFYVKENDLKDDWRFGKNYVSEEFDYLGEI